MSSSPRISLIHATPLAIAPITESFRRLWPDAKVYSLLEDSLTADLNAVDGDVTSMAARIDALTRYAVDTGAQGVLFTCSAFGPAIEAAAIGQSVPVLKPNEAMVSEALDLGTRICIVATFQPALAPIAAEFSALAKSTARPVELHPVFVKDALAALQEGDARAHDELVAAACSNLSDCDVICFAQFSMTGAALAAQGASGRTVLTTPDSAVKRLKSLIVR
ncbi:aspartate/glutamate racemase family protein [Paraburkholderia sp. BL25I1N1]|uniref:aspartate/glutamate racemase family protein n=1 Tax=Paraburkholderia sp. BL25I1N1 TaxID=1938804 RepID=UPI000D07E9AD|nr:aspartate/glutamate racemase family protein [Paraburkholderia sp. BL25I1N1]PRY04494.1 hypothetical protein B0G73_112172 [Paraburkholderia sp. BL25I1N1]